MGSRSLDTATDDPSEKQLKAVFALVKVLQQYFPLTSLAVIENSKNWRPTKAVPALEHME